MEKRGLQSTSICSSPLPSQFLVSYLYLSLLPPDRADRFSGRCARGNRSVEQDSTSTRLEPPPPPLPLSLPILSHSPFISAGSVYAEKYLPFSNNTPRLFHPRRSCCEVERVLIRGVILHSKFIRLSVPPPPSFLPRPSLTGPFSVVPFLPPPAMRRRRSAREFAR